MARVVANTENDDVTRRLADEGIERAAQQVLASSEGAPPSEHQQVGRGLAHQGQNSPTGVKPETHYDLHWHTLTHLGRDEPVRWLSVRGHRQQRHLTVVSAG